MSRTNFGIFSVCSVISDSFSQHFNKCAVQSYTNTETKTNSKEKVNKIKGKNLLHISWPQGIFWVCSVISECFCQHFNNCALQPYTNTETKTNLKEKVNKIKGKNSLHISGPQGSNSIKTTGSCTMQDCSCYTGFIFQILESIVEEGEEDEDEDTETHNDIEDGDKEILYNVQVPPRSRSGRTVSATW